MHATSSNLLDMQGLIASLYSTVEDSSLTSAEIEKLVSDLQTLSEERHARENPDIFEDPAAQVAADNCRDLPNPFRTCFAD